MTDRPHIWVYPGRCFGAPALAGHRLPTATVARYYSTLGEQETMQAYVIERDDIIACCWFEARYGKRRFKKGWSTWLEENAEALWEGKWDGVALPPMLDATPDPGTHAGATNPR